MAQQYPPQYPPQPKKKRGKGCMFFAVGAAVFVVIIVAASSNGSKNGDSPSAATSGTQTPHSAPAKQDDAKSTQQSPAQAFKAYVTAHGTADDKAAAAHVTKIQGADSKNDILDSADIYTDYSGDLMSGDTGSAKLIASSFRDWQASRGKESKNGLVTVYNKAGSILSNGQY